MENSGDLKASPEASPTTTLDASIQDAPFARGLATRAVVLLALLAAIKLAVVFLLRDHLFRNHYRLPGEPPGWTDAVAWWGFLVLGMGAVWEVSRECARAGPRASRVFGGWLLALGGLLLFLSFHEGARNYVYPVMQGILDWGDIGAYMQLNLFFRPPYLFAWIMGVAGGWAALERCGQTRWIPVLVALAGLGVVLLVFREWQFQSESLLVIDALGLAGWLGWRRAREAAGPGWMVVGTALLIGFYLLFADKWEVLSDLDPFLRMLLAGSVVLFAGASYFAARYSYWKSWSCFLPFFLSVFVLIGSRFYPVWPNYNHLICYALVAGQYLLHEAALVLGYYLLCRWLAARWPRGGRITADALAVAMALAAAAELGVVRNMGLRLDWDLVRFSQGASFVWQMVRPYLGVAALLALAVTGLYAGGVWGLNRRPDVLCRMRPRNPWFSLTALLLLALVGQFRFSGDKARGYPLGNLVLSSPLVRRFTEPRMEAEELIARADRLGLLPRRTAPPPKSVAPLNVFLIIMESSYNRHLSLFGCEVETQPLMSRYRDRMELFPNFYGAFPSSIHARISVLTGLYDVRDYIARSQPRIPIPTLFEILKAAGYRNFVYDSCWTEYAGFRDFLAGRGIEQVLDAANMPGRDRYPELSWGLREEVTLAAVVKRLEELGQSGERFFITYLPVAPHHPFDTFDERFEKFSRADEFWGGDFTGTYRNQLLYMDWIIASMIEAMERNGLLERTLVVITNDHGEMLGGKDGAQGHGWSLRPDLQNLPLILMDPRKKQGAVHYRLATHIDLLPTILGRLGIPLPSGQWYEGVSLDDPHATEGRRIYLTSFHERGLVEGDRYWREMPKGKPGRSDAVPAEGYRISFDGTRTIFTPVEEERSITDTLNDFEAVQNALIRHYDYYRKELSRRRRAPR